MVGPKLEKSIHDDGGAWLRGPLLGEGAYGVVHLAYFPNLPAGSGRFKGFPLVAAVKSADAAYSKELEKEKFAYEYLGESPYILRYLGEDTTVDSKGTTRLNLFLECASKGSLCDLVEKSKGFGLLESQARRFTRSILQGVKHIHKAGFVHCDLKLDNVLLVGDGRQGCQLAAKIGDLGACKRAEEKAVSGGTLIYLPPECLKRRIQGTAADIWGLGCIVFSMLTGKLVWLILPDVEEITKLPSERSCSKEAVDFVRQCLARDPTHRPTAEALLSHPFVCGSDDDVDDPQVLTFMETTLSREEQCMCM